MLTIIDVKIELTKTQHNSTTFRPDFDVEIRSKSGRFCHRPKFAVIWTLKIRENQPKINQKSEKQQKSEKIHHIDLL